MADTTENQRRNRLKSAAKRHIAIGEMLRVPLTVIADRTQAANTEWAYGEIERLLNEEAES